jgi:hypothetical protein
MYVCNEEDKDMEALAKKQVKRSLKNKKNLIKPKVANGKILLDKNNPLHRYIFTDGD